MIFISKKEKGFIPHLSKNGFANFSAKGASSSIGAGFTIIELIISIFILSVAVVGIFSAFSITIILTSDASDRLTATYLAQEGMEIVRNIRDTNWLNMDALSPAGATWLDGLYDLNIDCSCSSGTDCTNKGCEADYTTGTGDHLGVKNISLWAASSDQLGGNYLKIDSATGGSGFYNYTSGTVTKFKRKIIITPVKDVGGSSSHIIKVIAQVSWDKKATILNSFIPAGACNLSNCVTTEETLYDWYNTPGSAKDITALGFGLTGEVDTVGTGTVSVTVPNGTDVTSLAPIITISAGATASPSSGTTEDFTTPVTYTITAQDGSTQDYIVTVTVNAE